MASLIETRMTTAANMIAGIVAGEGATSPSVGYNFTWEAQNVNECDVARLSPGPFARMTLEPIESTNDDGNDGDFETLIYKIKIEIGFNFDSAKTMQEGQYVIMNAFDDIKRLFGRDFHLGSQGGGIGFSLYPRQTFRFVHRSNNVMMPDSYLETFWQTRIRAHRLNPDLEVL